MHIIIDFKNDTTKEQIDQYLSENACTVLNTYSAFDKVYLVSTTSLPPLSDIIESLQDNEQLDIKPVSYPTSEVKFSSSDINDWWKMASVKYPDRFLNEQTYQRRGQSAVVYLIDSGVDTNHTEFDHATVSNLWSFNGDFSDTNSHGTALASLLCGKTCSLADPHVKVIKIWQAGETTRLSHFLGALDAVANDLSNNTKKLSIINMSWGIEKNSYVENKIKTLISCGVVVVAAAGNSGAAIDNITPASMPEVFTVGAYDETFSPCDFSNYTGSVPTTTSTTNSGELDGWAPGNKIKVAMPGGAYGVAAGTSMAAAIHAAAVAYNSFAIQGGNGDFPSVLYSDLLASVISTGKKDYLDLSDVRYRNSKNVVTIYHGEPDGFNKINLPKPTSFVLNIASGQEVNYLLAPSFVFAKIVLQDPLPPGLSLNGLWLTGTCSTVELLTVNTTALCTNDFDTSWSIPFTVRIVPTDRLTEFPVNSNSSNDLVNNFALYAVEESQSLDKN